MPMPASTSSSTSTTTTTTPSAFSFFLLASPTPYAALLLLLLPTDADQTWAVRGLKHGLAMGCETGTPPPLPWLARQGPAPKFRRGFLNAEPFAARSTATGDGGTCAGFARLSTACSALVSKRWSMAPDRWIQPKTQARDALEQPRPCARGGASTACHVLPTETLAMDARPSTPALSRCRGRGGRRAHVGAAAARGTTKAGRRWIRHPEQAWA